MNYFMETNNIYILDSNVFIWAFFEWDSLHELSLEIFKEVQGNKIILPYCVIQEVCSIFAYRFWKQKADDFIKFVLNTENIELINNDVLDEVNFYLQFKEKISFVDFLCY